MQKDQSSKIPKDNKMVKLLGSLPLRGKKEFVAKSNYSEEKSLVECINNARKEWINANTSFEYAVESELVDYYTYKIKAYQVRYEYLLKIAKEKGLSL